MAKYSDGSEQFELNFHNTEVPATPPHPPTLDDLKRGMAAMTQGLKEASAPINVVLDAFQQSSFVRGCNHLVRELEHSDLARAIRLLNDPMGHSASVA